MALDRIVERAHGEVDFRFRRSAVGARRQEAEQGNANSADQQNKNGDDNAEKKVAHFRSFKQSATNCHMPKLFFDFIRNNNEMA
jgi:hypothetical protein